jgi:hypothetical protein
VCSFDPCAVDEQALEDAQLELTERTTALRNATTDHQNAAAASEELSARVEEIDALIMAAVQRHTAAVREAALETFPNADTLKPVSGGTAQKQYVDLVIRIASSLQKTGIEVDSGAVIISSPGGLFDESYTIIGLDGMRFSQSMLYLGGMHNIILRCRKREVRVQLQF